MYRDPTRYRGPVWAVALALALVCLLAADTGPAGAEKKVTLCHLPPGNPDNPQTLAVGESAVRAHLAHGDQLGACASGCQLDAAACDDGNACTTDACAADGQCSHAAVSCDDGNLCTLDLCDAQAGCLAVANAGAACDDRNACTGDDVCVGTICQGTPTSGCCLVEIDCDDGDPCTIDACSGGRCSNAARDCAVADKCAAGFCDPLGECATAPVSCDDGNLCTDDACDALTGCSHVPTGQPPQVVETSCGDGADNDCDGLADALDPDCLCGDLVAQASEECDGLDFKGQTCATLLGPTVIGYLTCTATCRIDTSTCAPVDPGFD